MDKYYNLKWNVIVIDILFVVEIVYMVANSIYQLLV
jgi:hypothetical protein